MYQLPCVFCTLVLEISARPETLCVFRYTGVFMCMIVKTITIEQQRLELLVVCSENLSMKTGR